MKKFYPLYFYENINLIDLDELKAKGINSLILDIDNTLVKPHTPEGDEYAKAFIKKVKDNGFKVCIVSNNYYWRAEKFANSVECEFVCDGNKPSKKPFLKALDILKENPNCVAVIGDQIFTDVWGANRMGMAPVLVAPICNQEGKFVKFKRVFEKLILKSWNKSNS